MKLQYPKLRIEIDLNDWKGASATFTELDIFKDFVMLSLWN
jgi:hypothetical protein